jgi:hypothetical protein
MNGKAIATIMMLLAAIIGYLGLTLYPNVTGTITDVGDAFVYQGMPTLNTGSSPYTELQSSITWQDSTPTDLRYIYMMFDISSIPTYAVVTDARLLVYISYVSTLDRVAGGGYTASTKGQEYKITSADTNWAETTITWNNQPSSGMPGAWHSQTFGGSYGITSGWFTWQVGGTAQLIMDHLKTDKKMAYVVFPDVSSYNRPQYCDTSYINIYSREKGGGFEPKLYVDYTIPSFTLTVSVKDADGYPVQGATVTAPFSASTDKNGVASTTLTAGSYTVTVTYKGLTYTQTVTLDADKTVSITIPKYTLTIKVVDPTGTPIPEAVVINPVSGKTDAYGTFSTRLVAGSYTVTVAFGSSQKSDIVDLSSAQTVTITLTPTYTVQFIVKDQCGNPLPARITFDTSSVACDRTGVATVDITKMQVTVKAEVKVGVQTYSTTQALTITKSMTQEITITRRFYWTFFINYTDGTLATGNLTASSAKETLTVPITSGWGEAYLTDATYTFSFRASPEVTLKTVSITNDGEFYATINKETQQSTTNTTQTSTTSPTSPTTTPEIPTIPWVLIPSIYIYALLGILVFGFIIAAVVRLRRP